MPPRGAPLLSIDVGKNAMAAVLLDPSSKKILRWKCWEVGNSPAAFVQSVDFIKSWLDPRPHAIIETQPAVNQKMRRFQHFFEIFLAMQGLAPRAVSPRLKLGLVPKSELTTYYRRKKASVAWATAFLQRHEQERWVHDTFALAKKKDDLSDALMQAVASIGGDAPEPKPEPEPEPVPPPVLKTIPEDAEEDAANSIAKAGTRQNATSAQKSPSPPRPRRSPPPRPPSPPRSN